MKKSDPGNTECFTRKKEPEQNPARELTLTQTLAKDAEEEEKRKRMVV